MWRTGHAGDTAKIQKQIVLMLWLWPDPHTENQGGGVKPPQEAEELHKRIRRMKPAGKGAERNNHCLKNQGHL